jgi:hypothetical protein
MSVLSKRKARRCFFEMAKSLGLNSYGMFHPIEPNCSRSSTTEQKNAR